MRVILILWAIPLILFWGWYGLSAYDLNFGLHFLSRDFHDLMFRIYSNMLGMPPEEIPIRIAQVFFIDSLFVFGAAALRWYKSWLPQTLAWFRELFTGKPRQREYVTKILERSDERSTLNVQPAIIGPMQPAE